MFQAKKTAGLPPTGFTLIELLVVISIMTILLTLFTVNFAGLRADRNLTIAQNELVTNLRKAQSYTLSSRNVAGAQSGQFFIIKLDGAPPANSGYVLQAMYNIFATPTPAVLLPKVESFTFPIGVSLSSIPITIHRDNLNVSPVTQPSSCGLVAFKAPFARAYLNSGCNVNNFQPNSDDYESLRSFITNTDSNHTSTDSYAVITLVDSTGTKSRMVMIRGASGVICPTSDGVTCGN